MRPTKVYILEDELVTQQLLKGTLEDFGYEVCGMAMDAATALKEIQAYKPDIAMLDIRVKGPHDGIWLSEQLTIPFIFLTAFADRDTLQRALKTRPSAYLVKPFEDSQVFAAIELALYQSSTVFAPVSDDAATFVEPASDAQEEKPTKELFIKDGHRHFKVSTSDILFLKSDGKYLEIHTASKRLIKRTSLVNFLNEHHPSPFVRVHKSYAVNQEQIQAFSATSIQLAQHTIPLSRGYKKAFLEQIEGTLDSN
ncbi:MAG: LytTR family transcriptional regulator DNA-binding domain-containing protein [Bacteroidota bacterium]